MLQAEAKQAHDKVENKINQGYTATGCDEIGKVFSKHNGVFYVKCDVLITTLT